MMLLSRILRLGAVAVLAMNVTITAPAQARMSVESSEKPALELARISLSNNAITNVGDANALTHVWLTADAADLAIEPAASPVQKEKQTAVSTREVRFWQTLTVSQHSSALFDAWSTRKALTSGNGYERNPLLRPFAQSATIYPATQIVPFALDFLSYRMMRSNHRLLRRTWWVPQTVSIIGSAWCGTRNLRVANLQR